MHTQFIKNTWRDVTVQNRTPKQRKKKHQDAYCNKDTDSAADSAADSVVDSAADSSYAFLWLSRNTCFDVKRRDGLREAYWDPSRRILVLEVRSQRRLKSCFT